MPEVRLVPAHAANTGELIYNLKATSIIPSIPLVLLWCQKTIILIYFKILTWHHLVLKVLIPWPIFNDTSFTFLAESRVNVDVVVLVKLQQIYTHLHII